MKLLFSSTLAAAFFAVSACTLTPDGSGSGPAAASSTGSSGAGSSKSSLSAAERQEFVDYHNKVRSEVGVGPLGWSEKLAASAQKHANRLAKTGQLKHDGPGENLAIGSGGGYKAINGAKDWYSEIKLYTPGTRIAGNNFMSFGHYTQMVWSQTSQIGVGVATVTTGRFAGGLVVVAHYNPPGNMQGEAPY
ncbi:MAG: CAP family protein [Verrucomicrobiota bacterium]